jgi:TP901 family phage tail tape measure protein
MTTRVLETVLTGRDLLSPVLAGAARNVAAFNTQVAGANSKAAAAASSGAAAQTSASSRVVAANGKTATSATTSANTQSRAHAQAAQSAGLSARAQESANAALARSNGLLGTSLTPLTAGLGAAALSLGFAAFKGMEFDSAMSRVQAATQASAGGMGRLREAAISLGADTQYSATEAAAGITELAKAGVSTADILNGGLKGALDLAAAGEMEVAAAAEIAATALEVFNLAGSQVPHVADLLAAGAGKAQGSVHDLGMALNQSALVASATGLSIEETTGSLAAFASAGLIGSDAGTSFRSMLMHLQNPSKEAAREMAALGINMYDANGAFVGMEALAGQLSTQLAGLSQAERDKAMATIFGSDAVRAANVLYEQGAQGIAEWTAQVNDAGYAARQAAQLNDNLRGDLEKLGGAVDSFFTSLGEGAQGPLRDAVQMLTVLVNTGGDVLGFFSSLPGPVQTAVMAFIALSVLRGPLTSLFDTVALKAMYAGDAISGAATKAGGFKGAMSGLLGAINPVTAGLALFTAGIAKVMADSADVEARLQAAADAGDSFRSSLAQNGGVLDQTSRASAELAIETAGLADAFDTLGISSRDAMLAMSGDRGSFDEILRGLEELDAQATITQESWAGFFGTGTLLAMDRVSGKATQSADAFREMNGVLEGVGTVTVISAGGFGRMAAAASAASPAMAAVAEETVSYSEAASAAGAATNEFKASLSSLGGQTVTLYEAQFALQDALAAAQGAMEGTSGSILTATGALNANSTAGRAVGAALFDVKDAGDQLIATMIQQGKTAGEVAQAEAALRGSFIQTAIGMGVSEAAANTLADEILGIPSERKTKTEVAVAEAVASARSVKETIESIPLFWNTMVTTTMRTVYETIGSLPLFGGVRGAIGGIVHAYAAGGIEPMRGGIAQIVPPNSLRVIGDRVRDDEAYIPINNDARSHAILAQTAERMGYALGESIVNAADVPRPRSSAAYGGSIPAASASPETVTPGILSREFSPAAQPGYGGVGGMAGGPWAGGAPSLTVHARVFVGNREITDIARVEATAVVDARDERLTRDMRSARR